MNVNIDTKFITLIGDPLRQSFAARMQNAGYEAAGLNMLYFYTEADNEHLGDIVKGLRYMNFAGFAVTKPNKIKVLEYLDELDPLCEKMGSSNTVVKTAEGKLVGYNTDGIGFYKSITEEGGIKADQCVFFCFGAGGAGRAMCSVLAYYGARKIYITDYFPEAAKSLVDDIAFRAGLETSAEEVERLVRKELLGGGVPVEDEMSDEELAAIAEEMKSSQLYFDACYNPAKTQFLLDAEEKGAKILNGLGMSLYQGAAQIELWTGKAAPVEAMRQELLDIISGK